MYHKIRITVVSVIAILMSTFGSTATLSYFTDTDAKNNDFIIGNASTSLAIYDDVTGNKRAFDASRYSPLTGLVDIPFYLQATNNGNIPVYQRFRVVIPKALASVVTLKQSENDCTVANACSNAYYDITYNANVSGAYAEYYIVSKNALPVNGATAEWPATTIHIGDISSVDNSLFVCANNSGNSCVLGINVYSDVIQTVGFTNAATAFTNFTESY